MEHKKLQNLFGIKVFREFDEYKRAMLRNYPEEIFNKAYQNDCFINFYEHLLQLSEEMSKEELQTIIFLPNFLNRLFDEWIHTSEWESDKMYEFVSMVVKRETINYMQEVA